jgi:thioredoxin reductase (NADPH)
MNDKIRDVVIIGAGPSALAAAVYTTREDIDTVLYEKGVIGGLAAITDMVDNYPGFPDGIAGMTLAEQLEKQAERFGAQIEFGDVSAIRDDGDVKTVIVDGIPGEAEYYGRGVHYCATCDGAFYREKKLVVVGGGNSAVQEAIFLTRFTSHIDLLVRSEIRASEVLIHDLQPYINDGRITVHLQTTTQEIVASDGKVSQVTATKEGLPIVFETDGVFIFVGLKPNTGFLAESGVELDEQGLIKTDLKLSTTIPGIFASGDVRSGATMQIASAVGEGATAALSIREYIDEHKTLTT